MSIKYLEHATDAFIEVIGSTLEEAFTLAADSVVDVTLDKTTIQEKEQKTLEVKGKDLRYLLLNWLEEVNYNLITKGFAIARFSVKISKNSDYSLVSTIYGEPIDLKNIILKSKLRHLHFI